MGYIALPIVADTPSQLFSIELDGTVYGFVFRYNTRSGTWMMDVRSTDDDVLVAGIAVRMGVNLLGQYSDERFPLGRLFTVNFVEAYVEADRNNFGRDVRVIYEEAA